MTQVPLKIAIAGSGPSGCYAAQFLRKAFEDAEITVFEALPVPYGLVRYGVAADHQGSKQVTAQFDRLFTQQNVRFIGNVDIGRDLAFADLAAAFDVVICATGLSDDRPLPMALGQGCKTLGAGAIIRALNGHPSLMLPLDGDGQLLPLGKRLAMIGNGNVSMDVIRLLAKPERMFTGSDIDDARLKALRAQGIESIDVFGRSPVECAKFDLAMLREILALPGISVKHSGVEDSPDCPAVSALRATPGEGPLSIRFHFQAVPSALTKVNTGQVLHVNQKGRGAIQLEVCNVITATGFCVGGGADGAGSDWQGEHVFRVGWLANGGKGTIAENRRSAKAVSTAICAAVAAGRIRAAAPGLNALLPLIPDRTVSFEGWSRIDAVERRQAPPDRLRRKITDCATMLEIAAGT